MLMIVSAVTLQRSATSPWGSARGATGSRIEVTPIGLYRTVTGSALQSCRWWPTTGDAALCRMAPGAEQSFQRLKAAYPFLQVGFWGAIAALFLIVLRVPRRRSVRLLTSLFAAACALTGALCVVGAAPDALAVFSQVTVSFRLSGALLAWLGTAAAAICFVVQLTGD